MSLFGLRKGDLTNVAAAPKPDPEKQRPVVVKAPSVAPLGLRVVCISDTHNDHHNLHVPDGDVLIHAGDFTNFGKEEHAVRFNQWLGTLPHKTKLVVNGNHESNAPWQRNIKSLVTNAEVLIGETSRTAPAGLRVYGTDFHWPCDGDNPRFDFVPDHTDILIAHGPAHGRVDGGKGCASLRRCVQRVRPRLVVSGHIHFARGAMVDGELGREGVHAGTVFVNAAICESRLAVFGAVVVDL